YLACTRELVERLPVTFERGVHRRNLLDVAAKTRQQCLELLARDSDGLALEHFTLSIGSGSRHAQLHYRLIALVGVEQVLGELRRLTEAQRQHACRQRIQATGMPCLLRIEQPSDLLQRGVG